jgi:Ca2+-binding RTX toxin-like protein
MFLIPGTEDDDVLFDPFYDSDNEIWGYGGWDKISGGGGDDVIFCGSEGDIAYGDDGLDVLYGEEGWDSLYGGAGDDWLMGGNGHDELNGDQGDDFLVGGSGEDMLDGGSGTDTANYGDSESGVNVNLAAGTGQGGTAHGDTLTNIENVDGSDHDDELTGDQFANKLHGSGGNDILSGGGGADSLWGGYGNDTASYQDSWEGVVVSLKSNLGKGGDAEGDMLWVENLTGSAHADELTGDDDVNTLIGGDGDDTLFGLNDDDTLFGGIGRDLLDGGKGIDEMYGGDDDDTYIVDHAGDLVIEKSGEGTQDRVQTSTTYALANGSEIEVLETTDAQDTTALGLFGNELDNTIIANAGANSLVGGMGRDVMTGNGGGDVFTWNSVAETGFTISDADVVTDFVAGLDFLNVFAIDANETNGAGNDGFEFIGNAAFTAPGQINYSSDRYNTYIFLNTDGDADAEGVISVQGSHTVDASWFVL